MARPSDGGLEKIRTQKFSIGATATSLSSGMWLMFRVKGLVNIGAK